MDRARRGRLTPVSPRCYHPGRGVGRTPKLGALNDLRPSVRILLAAGALVTAAPAEAALKFLWPRDGSVVRESVNVAVDASSLPGNASDAYVTFHLNDVFMVAAGASGTVSGGRKAFVWLWDTREPVNLGSPNDPPRRPDDGEYRIRAQAVSGDGRVVDSATVTVRLANRVTSVSPDTPVNLRYRYSVGASRRYAVRIGVTVSEIGGAPITSNQEIQTIAYTGLMSVMDVRDADRALIRYRPTGTTLRRFGRPIRFFPGFEDGSLYELVDSRGSVLDTDLFSTVGIRVDPSFGVDYRTSLPRRPVAAGARWQGPFSFSLPAMGSAARLDADFTLEGLEWAGGRECARIGSEFSGEADFQFRPVGQEQQGGGGDFGPYGGAAGGTGAAPRPARVKGTATDWFAFRTGDLVRREATIELDAFMDSGAVQAIKEGLGLGTGTGEVPQPVNPYARGGEDTGRPGPGDEEFALAQEYITRVGGLFRQGRAAATPAFEGTRVKLKIRISAKLIN